MKERIDDFVMSFVWTILLKVWSKNAVIIDVLSLSPLDACPGLCNGNGRCTLEQSGWHCVCQSGWSGPGCYVVMETECNDSKDNDSGKEPSIEDELCGWQI